MRKVRFASVVCVVFVGLLSLSNFAARSWDDAALRKDPVLPVSPGPGQYLLELSCDGYDRIAHVRIPKLPQAKDAPRPALVLVLHGAGGDGLGVLEKDGWAAKADEAGFLVLAPTGLPSIPKLAASFRWNPRVWNSGQLNPASARSKIDDVAYIAKLLDELAKKTPYDPKRVYVTGFSNGAGMTFRLGAELSERFRALAPVAGMLGIPRPAPKIALPTLYIIGNQDPLQPWAGGPVKLPWGERVNSPVSTYLTRWAEAIHCKTTPETISDTDGLKTLWYPSSLTPAGPSLKAVIIDGHGHHWPGGKPVLPNTLVGPYQKTLNATNVIWDFFRSVQP